MICIYLYCSTGSIQVLVRCLQRVAYSVWYALTFTAAQVLFRCWSGVFREWTVVHYTFTFTVALDLFRCRSGVFREWTVVHYTFTFTATLVLFRCWSGVFREWTVAHNTFTFTAALILFRCLQKVDYSVLYAFTFTARRISRGQVWPGVCWEWAVVYITHLTLLHAALVMFRCWSGVFREWTVRHEVLTFTASLNVFRCGCLHRVDGEAWSTDPHCIIERVQVWVSTQSGRCGMKHWPLLHHWTCAGVGVYTEWTVRHEALTLTASLNVFRCGCLHRVDGEAWSTDIYCIIERVQVWVHCLHRVDSEAWSTDPYCITERVQVWVSTQSGRWGMKHWPLLHHWTCSGVGVYTKWTVRNEALTLTASLNVFRCGCLHKVDGEEWSTDPYCITERVQVWVSTVSGQWSMKHWPWLHDSPTLLMMSLAFCWNSQLGVGQAASALWMQATASSPFLFMTTSTDRWVR